MSTFSKKKGQQGESLAIHYLQKNNFKIICRNFHSYYGEIDIIALKKEQLHFIEVKNYKENSLIPAIFMITKQKQKKIIKTAKFYLLKQDNPFLNCQFDVILIQANQKIEHLQNAFY